MRLPKAELSTKQPRLCGRLLVFSFFKSIPLKTLIQTKAPSFLFLWKSLFLTMLMQKYSEKVKIRKNTSKNWKTAKITIFYLFNLILEISIFLASKWLANFSWEIRRVGKKTISQKSSEWAMCKLFRGKIVYLWSKTRNISYCS